MAVSPLRLPIGQIVLILLVLFLGLSGITVVAIAPQWMVPQWMVPQWVTEHYLLDLTLGNVANLDARISLATWYSSSILLISAMLLLAIATLTIPPERGPWLRLGILSMVFSADKSTGLHHALIHDFLYRMPFPLIPKKIVLGCVLGLFLFVIGCLIITIWPSIGKRAQRLFMISALCLLCSEMGLNILGHQLFIPFVSFSPQSTFLAVLEQSFEQMASIIMVWALLTHIQTILQKISL